MHLNKSVWEGVYNNFSEIDGDLDVFASDIWINKQREKTLNAINNYRAKLSYSNDYPLAVVVAMELVKNSVKVLDFGGGMGLDYIDLITKVPEAQSIVDYYVVDGKALIENRPNELNGFSKLYFRESIENIEAPINIIHFGSTLQYIEKWKELLLSLAYKYSPHYFVFSDLQAGDVETFITHQVFYDKKIPHIFLNLVNFKSFMLNELKMKLIFQSKFIRNILGQDKLFPNHGLPSTHRIDRPCNLIFSKCK